MWSVVSSPFSHSGQLPPVPISAATSSQAPRADPLFMAARQVAVLSPALAHMRTARVCRSIPSLALATCSTHIMSAFGASVGAHLRRRSLSDDSVSCCLPTYLRMSEPTHRPLWSSTHRRSLGGSATLFGLSSSAASFARLSATSFQIASVLSSSVWARTHVTSIT